MRLALIGANGMLARAAKSAAQPGCDLFPFDLPEFDITDRNQVLETIAGLEPDVILNCAAFTNVDGCESEEALATRVNGDGPGYLAAAAKETGATLVHISTDYVFDGLKREPYTEDDETHPRSAYGRTKLVGEQAILDSGLEKFFILRTSWLYGPGGKNFVETIIRLAREREDLGIVADQIGTPTYTEDLAEAIFLLLALPHHSSPVTRHGLYGLYHFSNEGQCSWCEFAREIVARMRERGDDLKVREIRAIKTEEYPLPASRPAYSVFSKEKYKKATGAQIPEWQESLGRYLERI
jgi:dTDP-4-dehydrorhamnose reductase